MSIWPWAGTEFHRVMAWRSSSSDHMATMRATSARTAPWSRQISAPVPPGQSKAIIASARRQAAREGHLSNFSKAERGKLG